MTEPILGLDLLPPLDDATTAPDPALEERAQGLFLGALVGDALGEQCEFLSAAEIARLPTASVETMHGHGYWRTAPGQPTDDMEMALVLARTIVARGAYDAEQVAGSYVGWMESRPFDIGRTTTAALRAARDAAPGERYRAAAGAPTAARSQANGAMMRCSPLALWGLRQEPEALDAMVRLDAAITHPHRVCGDANVLYVRSLVRALWGASAGEVLLAALADARAPWVEPSVREAVEDAMEEAQPAMDEGSMGWVLHALRNALWQLRNAESFRAGILDTIRRGGDTDTNACIAGALLGAVEGRARIPAAWRETVLSCQPGPTSARPRPRTFWPVDAPALVRRLLDAPQ
jgi:ADP-ribosylglycohydrolase